MVERGGQAVIKVRKGMWWRWAAVAALVGVVAAVAVADSGTQQAAADVGAWAMSLDRVPLLRLLAVAVVAVVAVAAGALVFRFLCRPRQARRAAAVVLAGVAFASVVLASSRGRAPIEGQEVLIGQPFVYNPALEVVIDSVECGKQCVVEATGTNILGYMTTSGCPVVLSPFMSLVGRRGTIYEPQNPWPGCPTALIDFPYGASATANVVFDVTENGFVDLLDVWGNDEVVAVVLGPSLWFEGPDHYALVDPYDDQSRSWVAVGLVKLLLFAAAGAAGAALLKLVPFLLKIKRRKPAPDPTGSLVADPDTAERVLGDLIRGTRSGGPDTSQ